MRTKSFSLIEWCKVGNNLLDVCRWMGWRACDDVDDVLVAGHWLRLAAPRIAGDTPIIRSIRDENNPLSGRFHIRRIDGVARPSTASSASSSASSAFVLLRSSFVFPSYFIYNSICYIVKVDLIGIICVLLLLIWNIFPTKYRLIDLLLHFLEKLMGIIYILLLLIWNTCISRC